MSVATGKQGRMSSRFDGTQKNMTMPYIETEIITRKQIIADSLRLATWHIFFVSWCKGQLILMHLYIGCVHIFCSNLWPQRKNGEK